MLDRAKVQCADLAPCVSQDFEIATGRTTADYADVSDEEIIPGHSSVSVSVLSA
jgi:hypothetical protein